MVNIMKKPNYSPLFIVGAQRSGTTLLRLMLNAHSEVAIPEEGRFLMPLLEDGYLRNGFSKENLRNLVSYLALNEEYKLWNYDNEAFLAELAKREYISLKEVIDGIYSSYARSEGKIHWADKSLFFSKIGVLTSLFPDARFIHVVRDGRDVFDSWRKMLPEINNVAVAAIDWNLKLGEIDAAFSKLPADQLLTIRYEDLIESPGAIVHSICDFVGLTYEESMLEFYKASNRYIGEHHSALIFSPIDRNNKFKWLSNLTEYEKTVFSLLSKSNLNRFGYDVPQLHLSLLEILRLFVDLTIGIPKRGGRVLRNRWRQRVALRKGRSVDGAVVGLMPKNSASSSNKNI